MAEEARLGARSTLDVLDADQERLQAEAEIVQALRDEYVAAYALLQAMGLLTVEHLKLGIATYDPDVNFKKVRNGPSGGYDTSAPSTGSARAGSATSHGAEPAGRGQAGEAESLAEVLASIRALVSAETEARMPAPGRAGTVLMLTPEMRAPAGRPRPGAALAEGLEAGPAAPAPILDEGVAARADQRHRARGAAGRARRPDQPQPAQADPPRDRRDPRRAAQVLTGAAQARPAAPGGAAGQSRARGAATRASTR